METITLTERAELHNLCPHPIEIYVGDALTTVIPSAGLARCAESRVWLGSVQAGEVEVPMFRVAYGAVEGLPAPVPGRYYVVSPIVFPWCAQHAPERTDLLTTVDLVRNDRGTVVGTRALAHA